MAVPEVGLSSFSYRLLSIAIVLGACALHAEDVPPPKPAPLPAEAKPADNKDAAPPTEPVNPPSLETVHVSDTVVTTPVRTATPVPAKTTGVSVTVIDGKENAEVFQNIELSQSLKNVPGITVNRSGQNGDFTTLFTRGGNSNQTLFMYDGFTVNRQGGNFNLGPVDPIQADRIEVVRGPSSSLYGADAVTGTINVLTAKGFGDPSLTTSAAGGTYDADRETIQLQGVVDKFAYNIGTAHFHRGDTNYENSDLSLFSYTGRLDYQINDCHSLKFIFRGSDEHKGFAEDSASGYGPLVEIPDPNDKLMSDDFLAGLEYKGSILPIWDLTFKMGDYGIDYHVVSTGPNPASNFGGFSQPTGRTYARERRPQFDLQNDIIAFECDDLKDIVTVGANFTQETFDQQDSQFGNNVSRMRSNWAEFLQNRVELFERAYITGGIRQEQNEQFGSFTTGHGDVSILIPESDSRIHGSIGNAFRAPSFFEFFGAFGDPNLKPEHNFAWDGGVEQYFWKKRIVLGATYFSNHFRDLIDFDAAFKFQNLRTAETNGLELNAEFDPIKQFTLRATGTLQHTEDDKGQALLRRPGETYTASAIGRPLCGLELSLDMLHEGPRRDLGPGPNNPFAKVINGSFTRFDAAVNYRFLCHWRVFGKLENLTNERYEQVKTFASPQPNFLGGLEFNWRF